MKIDSFQINRCNDKTQKRGQKHKLSSKSDRGELNAKNQIPQKQKKRGKVMSMLQLSLIAGSGVELARGSVAQEVVQNQAKRNYLALGPSLGSLLPHRNADSWP